MHLKWSSKGFLSTKYHPKINPGRALSEGKLEELRLCPIAKIALLEISKSWFVLLLEKTPEQ